MDFTSIIEAANAALVAGGRKDAAEQFFTADYVAHLTDRDLTGGPPAVRRYVDMLHGAFEDIRVDVEVLMEESDRVAWYRTVTGMHRGEFAGFTATGRRIVWRDMIVSRFEGGRIAEEWAVSDLAEHLLRAKKG